MLVRVVDGTLSKGERIRLMASNDVYPIEQLGVFTPKSEPRERLAAGEVGFIIAGIKELKSAKVGDTITLEKKLPNNAGPSTEPLPGFKEIKPQVFAGPLFPPKPASTTSCGDALGKTAAQRFVVALRAGGVAGAGASAFAAAFSACCTWRSCRSGWSASSIRI